MPASHSRLTAIVLLLVLAGPTGCSFAGTRSATSPTCSAEGGDLHDLALVGRIVTMDDPPIAEAVLIEDGTVAAIGTRDEVLVRACANLPVIDLGDRVAYPGFIDAHAHWIGDRGYYGVDSAEEAMDLASGAAGPPSPSSGSTRSAWPSLRRLPPTTPSPCASTPTSP